MKRWKRLSGLILTGFLLASCGEKEISADPDILFPETPDYSYLLHTSLGETNSHNQDMKKPFVNVYISNTRNMRYFALNEDENPLVNSPLENLIYSIQDMERIYGKTSYYTLQKKEDTEMVLEWRRYKPGTGLGSEAERETDVDADTETKTGIYEDFLLPEFYLTQEESDDVRPLSRLYGAANKEWEPSNINIVITDLAERNMEVAVLAKQIRSMCQKNNCDAYMLVFQLECSGMVKVPKPEAPDILIEKKVETTRPCYVMVTGPSFYLDQYMDSFFSCMENVQLRDGEKFHQIEFHIGRKETRILPEQINGFLSEEDKSAFGEKNFGIYKNIIDIGSAEDVSEEKYENPELRFSYALENTMEQENDWRLDFKVLLKKPVEDHMGEYGGTIRCYQLKQTYKENGDTEKLLDSLQWEETEDSPVEECIRFSSSYGTENAYIRLSGKPRLKQEAPVSERKLLLVIITITYTEIHPYRMPEWADDYIAVSEEGCGQKTYGLEKLFQILFGCENGQTEDKAVPLETIYGEIPILISVPENF